MTESSPNSGGLIRLFARHPTAANLLMAAMVLGGLLALDRVNTQFFPDFGIDIILITVPWPGASAEDVDSNIVQALEPSVRFLDGVKRVISDSLEGAGSLIIEYKSGTDMQKALSEVENAVGEVTTLPEDSERPAIRRIDRYDTISRLILHGNFSEPALKAYAKQIRDELLALGVDRVDIGGAREEMLAVEVNPATLRQLDITLAEVARRIAESSQDLPAGTTKGDSERQIRSLGQEKRAIGLKDIEIRALDNGEKLRLADIASVSDTYKDFGTEIYYDGKRAMELVIQRSRFADALEIADTVNDYVAKLQKRLPPGLHARQYGIEADLVRSRRDLLLRNGIQGLVVVLVVLFVFLNFRVGFWVAAAIPVSLLATTLVMLVTGQTINMISMFALIMVLGIIVDDAIVVGEHAEAKRRAGLPPLLAAEEGGRRMFIPVMASSLTTVAAFAPLMFISDIIGKVISAIPYVAIAVLLASLVECFLVLPNHMAHALRPAPGESKGFRRWFDGRFEALRDGPFSRLLQLSVRWRYVTVALALACFILSIGILAGGRLAFHFFKAPEADRIYANLTMVPGTPRSATLDAVLEMERALITVEQRLGGAPGSLIDAHLARVGSSFSANPGRGGLPGDHMGALIVELHPSDQRDVRTSEIIDAWLAEISEPAGTDSIAVEEAMAGPPGRDVDVRIRGRDVNKLKSAAEQVKSLLASYPGVSNIQEDLPYGKEEMVLEVSPRGRALGFTTEDVARQVRNAFQGTTAQRFPRGDEEVELRVQMPDWALDGAAFQDFFLRSPAGYEVPLSEVVVSHAKTGFARIRREDGERRVAITAELNKELISTSAVIENLERDGLSDILADQDATVRFAGRAEEQAQTLGDLGTGAVAGMLAIYIILAWVFGSYAQPLVVMSVIPLALVGTVLGHLVTGYDMTILSLVALIGLSGVVVNDSIILVSTIKEHLARHEDFELAIVSGTKERLRAVVLTSLTTMGGLFPLLFETSFQARFMVPMAVTIVFGLMMTTIVVLFVAPALLAILEDITLLRQRLGFGGETIEEKIWHDQANLEGKDTPPPTTASPTS